MLSYSKDDLPSDDVVSSESFQKNNNDSLEENKENIEENISKKLKYSSLMPLKEKSKELTDKDEEALCNTPKGKFILEAVETAQNKWLTLLDDDNKIKANQVIPVCEMPIEEYEQYCELFPLNCYFESGVILMKEMPHKHHDTCNFNIGSYFRTLFKDTLLVATGGDCRIGRDRSKTPDVSAGPRIRHSKIYFCGEVKFQYPTIAVEVANLHEDLDLLKKELLNWIRPYTTVQIAMGLKLGRHPEGYSLTFLIVYRNSTTFEEYEIGVVDKRGLPIDQSRSLIVPIPLKMVYESADIPDVFKGLEFVEMNLEDLSILLLRDLSATDNEPFE